MMKKTIILLGIIGVMSFSTTQTKNLKVELQVKDWESGIGAIEIAKKAIRESDLPVKTALSTIDSLTVFENKILVQLNTQLKDSTNGKK